MANYKQVMFELLSYQCLKENWDGYGGIVIPKKMIDSAWIFLGILIENKITSPNIMVSGSGEIAFYWKIKTYIEISIGPDEDELSLTKSELEVLYKSFTFVIDGGGDNVLGGDNIPFVDFKKSKVFKPLECIKGEEGLPDYHDYYYKLMMSGRESRDI